MAPLHPAVVANHTRPSLFASTNSDPNGFPSTAAVSSNLTFQSPSRVIALFVPPATGIFYPHCQFPQASFPFRSQDTTSWPDLATKSCPPPSNLTCVIPRDGPPSHLIGHHRSSPPGAEMSPVGFLSSDRGAHPSSPGQARRSCCVAPKRRYIARLSSHHHSST